MTFFNKKEEVLDIQLTRYGKDQLAKGKLKPVYYAFFDDDILYDSEYANFTEDQNSIEPRIQENTVSLRTQHLYEGVEFSSGAPDMLQHSVEKHYSLVYPLGKSSPAMQYAPAWNIKFLEGEVEDINLKLTGSHQAVSIPQINVDVTFKTIVKDLESDLLTSEHDDVYNALDKDLFLGDRKTLTSQIFEDGTYVEIRQDPLLIDIFEENTEFDMENVLIEFYEVESVDVSGSIQTPGVSDNKKTKKEILKPLKFVNNISNVQNKLLVPTTPTAPNLGIDSNYVEYYLDVLVDSEIPSDVILANISKITSLGVDTNALSDLGVSEEALELSISDKTMDIYSTNVVEENDPASDCEDTESCQD